VSAAPERTHRPTRADEATTLRGFLGYQRDTLRMKCADLTQAQLAQQLPSSDLTLAGLMKHLAGVESDWLEERFAGRSLMPPFDAVDWDADPDWEWRTARDDTPEELRALFDEACRRSDAVLDEAMAGRGMDAESVQTNPHDGDRPVTLRWIVLHLIEEYARHNGHADLLRQAVDGQTGL
jgi:uncharacterized damage-inducible protein DinB